MKQNSGRMSSAQSFAFNLEALSMRPEKSSRKWCEKCKHAGNVVTVDSINFPLIPKSRWFKNKPRLKYFPIVNTFSQHSPTPPLHMQTYDFRETHEWPHWYLWIRLKFKTSYTNRSQGILLRASLGREIKIYKTHE